MTDKHEVVTNLYTTKIATMIGFFLNPASVDTYRVYIVKDTNNETFYVYSNRLFYAK